ncbi:hypothetical protein [Corynebacterium glutamicum]|uniref:hypothetical protein n=1 Tax=Corynebacterium glutamicum TaxID=1718 RepID=UPI001B8AA56A|nr:hypothetical protein [Corynebacterium glutamicum]
MSVTHTVALAERDLSRSSTQWWQYLNEVLVFQDARHQMPNIISGRSEFFSLG